MKELLTEMERDFAIVHLIFSIICGIILFIPGIPIGIKLFILVIIYNIMVPLVGIWRKYSDWLNIWLFSFILSIFQLFPDWFLSAQLNVLVFPEDGLFKIGTVSGYMLFLWAIPFFIILFIGYRINENYTLNSTYLDYLDDRFVARSKCNDDRECGNIYIYTRNYTWNINLL